ncbi:hypothetical protein JD844_034098 [Phrynosoma platyrhinos]|uniref:SH2 domain-containing protein n=1 Tax=Phrynosoma platyrhinos TaxID=52577 RepID=A0ABQ7T7W8_PHRPL|nr:hypothetical protein JD844_034098 [Phrynosoma platyrhinos]
MLAVPKYDRFWNDALTPSEKAAMSGKVVAATLHPSPAPPGTGPLSPPRPPASPSPPLGEEPESGTTFCMLIPKMPQWKFTSPSGFLSRSPSSASKELSGKTSDNGNNAASAGSTSGLAAVLSACEPVCATPCSLQVMNRLRGGPAGGRKVPRTEGHKVAGEEWSRKGSFISKPVQGKPSTDCMRQSRGSKGHGRKRSSRTIICNPSPSLRGAIRTMGMEDSGWGEEEETPEHDYYNSIPGKEPPLGGLVDSRLQHSASLSHVPIFFAFLFPGLSTDGYVQADGKPLGSQDYEDHMYVNTQNLDNWEADLGGHRLLDDSPPKDLFDMRPFEDALKLHESMSACGMGSGLHIEDQWPSPPTRKAPIAPTEEQLKQEPWYHGKMSRKDAEKLLQMDGDFLVRDSITNPGQYVLTGMHSGQPKHLLLVDPEGVPIVAAESELHLRQVVRWKP